MMCGLRPGEGFRVRRTAQPAGMTARQSHSASDRQFVSLSHDAHVRAVALLANGEKGPHRHPRAIG